MVDQLYPISEDGELFERYARDDRPVPAELASHPTREWDFDPDTGDIEVIDEATGARAVSLPAGPGFWATLVAYEDGTLGFGIILEDGTAPHGASSYAVLLPAPVAARAREFLRDDD